MSEYIGTGYSIYDSVSGARCIVTLFTGGIKGALTRIFFSQMNILGDAFKGH
jgi:hypothetical protein